MLSSSYVAPQIEVVEIELEGVILADSLQGASMQSVREGGKAW